MELDRQLQARVLTVVAKRFVNLKETTARKDLVLQFERGEEISDLARRGVLRCKDNAFPEQYLPNAAAFEFCDDPQLRETAKRGVTAVLHALKNIYKTEREDRFSFADLQEHVRRIFPTSTYEDDTLKLGLYLVSDFNVLQSRQMNADQTEIVAFQVGESIITRGDLNGAWDAVVSAYKPMPVLPAVQQSSEIDVEGMFLPGTALHDELGFEQLLHPAIEKSSYKQYCNGHFRDAVLNSVVAVFDHIRNLTGIDADGEALVNKAFSLDDPFIVLSELDSESGKNDQKGFMQIFRGTFQGIRNPAAHSLNHDLTAEAAAQYLIFASLLARRLDQAKILKRVSTRKASG